MEIREYKIYCFIDENDVPYYVGQTYNMVMRIRAHNQFINDTLELKSPSKYPYYRKARKLIRNGHEFRYTVLEDNLTKEEADIKEYEYIKNYRELYNILNILEGGEFNQRGKFVSDETKKKISDSKIGKPLSEVHRQTLLTCKRTKRQWTAEQKKLVSIKVSEAKKGMKCTEEQLNRLRTCNVGRKHSDVVNMKKGRKAEKHSRSKKYKLTSPDGIEYVIYGLNVEFCKKHNLSQPGLFLALKEKRRYKQWQIELLS